MPDSISEEINKLSESLKGKEEEFLKLKMFLL